MSVFGLGGLLRVRAFREESAAAELGAAERTRRARRARADDTLQRLAATGEPSDDLAWRATIASRVALSSLLTEHSLDAAAADAVADERRAAWSAARRDLRAVERLAEHHEERERLAENRAEQHVLDEAAARLRGGGVPGHDGTSATGHGQTSVPGRDDEGSPA